MSVSSDSIVRSQMFIIFVTRACSVRICGGEGRSEERGAGQGAALTSKTGVRFPFEEFRP
jgi:hypothetical protein